MAGSFGFEADQYDVSLAVAERVLLPAVRAAGPEALIVADGFSCREQIRQLTERRALHLAEVLAGAGGGRRLNGLPDRRQSQRRSHTARTITSRTGTSTITA